MLDELQPCRKQRYRVDCYACGGDGWNGCEAFDDEHDCDICKGQGSLIVTELTEDNCDNAVPIVAADSKD